MNPTPKPVPTKYNHMIDCHWTRNLSLKERLQIAFGYRLWIRLEMATQHSPGNYVPKLTVGTSEVIHPGE